MLGHRQYVPCCWLALIGKRSETPGPRLVAGQTGVFTLVWSRRVQVQILMQTITEQAERLVQFRLLHVLGWEMCSVTLNEIMNN